jgi:uncharacterized protein with WD repeat
MEGSRPVKLMQSEEEKKNPMRLLIVSKEGAHFYRLIEASGSSGETLEIEKNFPTYPTATLAKFAPNKGRLAIIADPIGLHIVDCHSAKELRLILRSVAISAVSFSPLDTFFVTCEKFVQGEKNLIVWDIATGNEVAQFEWKKGSKEGTKSIKFSNDEKFCARLSSRT